MDKDALIEVIARRLCSHAAYDPDGADEDTLLIAVGDVGEDTAEPLDGWANWRGYVPDAEGVLGALNDAGLVVVPREATERIINWLIDNGAPIGCCSISTKDEATEQYEGSISAGEIKVDE